MPGASADAQQAGKLPVSEPMPGKPWGFSSEVRSAAASCKESAARSGCVSSRRRARSRTRSMEMTSDQAFSRAESCSLALRNSIDLRDFFLACGSMLILPPRESEARPRCRYLRLEGHGNRRFLSPSRLEARSQTHPEPHRPFFLSSNSASKIFARLPLRFSLKKFLGISPLPNRMTPFRSRAMSFPLDDFTVTGFSSATGTLRSKTSTVSPCFT